MSVCSSSPLNLAQQPRLSHAAQFELHNLHSLLASLVLEENVPVVRVSRIDSRTLTTKSAYLAAFDHLQDVPFATPIWKKILDKPLPHVSLAGRSRAAVHQSTTF
jgi:hypothetical protein